MKNAFFAILFCLPLFCAAQTTKPITGFLGIPFGSSKQAVIAAVKAKGGTEDADYTTAKKLGFDNVKIGNRTADVLFVFFDGDKAFEAEFNFSPSTDAQLIDFYNALSADIQAEYGKGEAFKKFTAPYKDGDGKEIEAIKDGKAKYITFWSEKAKATGNVISLRITETGLVRLNFQNSKLTKQANGK